MCNSEKDIQTSINKLRMDISYYEIKLELARDDVQYLCDKIDECQDKIYELEKELYTNGFER